MKTVQAEGLIACAWPGGSLIGRGDVSAVGRILFAVELSAGQLRYVFDGGAVVRPLLVHAATGRPLNDNRWHDVAVVIAPATSTSARGDLRHTLHVDNTTTTDWLPPSTTSTVTTSVGSVVELFVGGVTPGLYHSLPKQVCLSSSSKIFTDHFRGPRRAIVRTASGVNKP